MDSMFWLKETDPKGVFFEMDLLLSFKKPAKTCWHFFSQYPGRFAMWHVKDMDNTCKRTLPKWATVVINFKKIFTYAKQSGMKYFFVEQDQCPVRHWKVPPKAYHT